MQECESNACGDAAEMLQSAISGQSGLFGCDLGDMIAAGDPQGKWYAGYTDMIASKMGYLNALTLNGIIAHSAFLTFATQKERAWQIVNDGFEEGISSQNSKLQLVVRETQQHVEKYAKINFNRYFSLHSRAGHQQQADRLFEIQSTVSPQYSWLIQNLPSQKVIRRNFDSFREDVLVIKFTRGNQQFWYSGFPDGGAQKVMLSPGACESAFKHCMKTIGRMNYTICGNYVREQYNLPAAMFEWMTYPNIRTDLGARRIQKTLKAHNIGVCINQKTLSQEL